MIFLKKYKVLFIAFFAISLNTFSQEIVIKDFQDSTIIPNITVHNVNKTKSILSNLDGMQGSKYQALSRSYLKLFYLLEETERIKRKFLKKFL